MLIKITLHFEWINQASYSAIEMTILAERAFLRNYCPREIGASKNAR